MAFDQAEYIKKQNEREAADRAGKPVEPVKAAPAEPVAVVEDEDEDDKEISDRGTPGDRARRSTRRTENRLREEAAEERGRRLALEGLLAQGIIPKPAETKEAKKEEDPEPQRKDFPDDATYNRALGRWDARQEANALLGKRDEAADNAAAIEALRAEIIEADKKMNEDIKNIPDWDEVKASVNEDAPTFNTAEHPYLMRRIATSDVKAFVLHHLAKHPEDMQKLLDLTTDLDRQAQVFSRLEGKVEKMYSTEKPKNVSEEKKQETAADRDAKKPRPSESGSPRGGSAPVTTIKPFLEDGKTLNPAWKAQQNEREGLRR